jgi:2-polyprenyl-3-methyl-5-hydroxy-6-metoxy-1,4-benzoquinol methylase
MNQSTPKCWCGNSDLTNFSTDYWHCSQCDSLVAKDFPEGEISRVSDDEKGFYGKEYWLSHQTEGLGLQSIETRSRTDLLDRCGHWLNTLLKFRLPPGALLDIGCSHGAFVALAELAGYTPTGLELSPWVVDYGHKVFEARILLGPVEEQNFAAGSFDVITLFDVLEHLQDPRRTIKECVRILSPGGILIIQTPCFPAENFKRLHESEHPFLKMMLPDEHLFLLSQQAVVRLLQEEGLQFAEFEKAPFSDYDMLLVAGRSELKSFEDKERWEALRVSPTKRLLDGYVTQDEIVRDLNDRLARALNDADVRLENVMKLDSLLKESEKDRTNLRQQLETLDQLIKTVFLPIQQKYERIPKYIKEICLRIWK